MQGKRQSETSLYGPVKRYLETLGYTVKGEVCGCDLVAIRGDEPPVVVIGELKLSFSLDLVLQAVDRTAARMRATLSWLPRAWPYMMLRRMQPKPMAETSRPLLASLRLCMVMPFVHGLVQA